LETTIKWISKIKHRAKFFFLSIDDFICFCVDSFKNICYQLFLARLLNRIKFNPSHKSMWNLITVVKLANLVFSVCFADMKTFWQHLYICIFVTRTFVHSFTQQCKSVPFHREIGFALDGHVIETSSLYPDDCLWHCRTTVNCFSVNVRKVTHTVVIFLSICLTKVN